MKFKFMFIFFLLLFSNNFLFAQTAKITLKMTNASLEDVFTELEKTSGYGIFYKTNDIDNSVKNTFDYEDVTISEILTPLLKKQNLTFQIVDKNVVVSKVDNNQKSEKVIKGKVTDSEGEPLPGATVFIPETNQGITTGLDGNFIIEPKEGALTLQISFMGMEPKEIGIDNKTTFDIALESNLMNIEEVVVVGYGTQRKVNLTGSVGVVSAEELEDRPITNLSSGLSGKVPGMSVIQSSGQPGRDDGSIRIRGIGTFGDASPLVLIDGMLGDMNDVNPSDVESISVLKDAASSAIYGARAANGVILITTKKGSKNKISTITYEAYGGWQKLTNIPQYLSSAQYATLYNEARRNDGLPPTYTAEEIQLYKNGNDPDNYPDTDWIDQVFSEPGFQQNHSLSFLGGNEKIQYNTSMHYFEQNGLVKGTGNEKYNLRINLTNQLTKRLQTNVIVSLSRQTVSNPVSSRPDHNSFQEIIHQAHRINPTVPNIYSDGTYGTHTDGNPVAWLNTGSNLTSVYDRTVANLEGKYDVIKGLTATGRVGIYNFTDFGKTDVKDLTYYRPGTIIVERYEGPSSVADFNAKSLTSKFEFLLNYEKKIAEKHNFTVLLGASQESNDYSDDYGYRRDIASPSLSQILAGSEDGQISRGDATSWALRSQFARLTYNYNERYLIEGNVRRDGTSRFSPDNRWGIFPSFSAAWRLSEEPFMESFNNVDNIKIRASWGQLGNQNISGLYPYISTVSLGWNYPFNEIMNSGAAVSSAAAENITWETAVTNNIGIDLSFWQSKLDITAEYYNMKTDGLLLQLPVNPVFGLPAPLQNAAVMRNKGLEFIIRHNNTIGKFNYGASFNIARNNNVVEDLKGTTPQLGTYTIQEGVSYHAFFGYENLGLFADADDIAESPTQDGSPNPGDIKYKDQLTVDTNGDGIPDTADGKIDGDDRVVLGNSYPGIEYGLSLWGSFWNFDLTVFFKGSADVLGYISSDPIYGITSGASLNEIHLDRWYADESGVPQNPSASFPRLTLDNSTANFAPSDYWIRNAAYVRVKTLQFGYTLPKGISKKLTINSARIYFSGENLFTFTNFPTGFDPETPNNAYDYYYPQVKIYSFGFIVKI